MDLVDKAFLQWERLNQPRRAKARLVAPEPTLCALQRNIPQPDIPAERGAGADAPSPVLIRGRG